MRFGDDSCIDQDGAGHLPQWEQAEKFNALIDAFVGDVK
jgi:pimeloyl-ACP methyl ester carboxylesterase